MTRLTDSEGSRMPRHSVVMINITANPSRKKGLTVDMSDLDGKGLGALEIFQALMLRLQSQDRESLVDNDLQRFVSVESVEALGRFVFVNLDAGDFGYPGRIRSIKDGSVVHEHGEAEAATGSVRMILALPPQATGAVLFVERVGTRSASASVVRHFKMALQSNFPSGITFRSETVTETNEWLNAAYLSQITARYYGWSSDSSDSGIPRIAGELVATLVPSEGGQFAPDILRQLRARTVKPGMLLGLEDEPDEAVVTLQHDGRSKSFVLGKAEHTPAIAELLSDSGEVPPDDEEFKRRIFELARDHVGRLTGQPWTSAFERGDWTANRPPQEEVA